MAMPLAGTKKVGRGDGGRKGVIRDCFSYGLTMFGVEVVFFRSSLYFCRLSLWSGEWFGRTESRVMHKTCDANLSVRLE